jgi:DNA-directed RNA polymerase subunit RPC12/RpoP
MNCINCGSEIVNHINSVVVCPKCGTPNLVSPNKPIINQLPSQHTLPSLTYQSTSNIQQPVTSHFKKVRPLIIISCSVAVLLLGGAVFALKPIIFKPKTQPATVQTKAVKPETKPVVLKDKQPVTTPSSASSNTASSSASTPQAPQANATPCYQIDGISSRSTTDRPDDNSNNYLLHIIYAVPSDGTDHQYDINGRIASSVSSWQNWLCQQTAGKYMRLDTSGGKLDVTFIKLSASDNTIKTGADLPWSTNPNSNPYIREDLQLHLQKQGFSDSRKLYAVYYDGTSNYSCGGGAFPPTLTGHVAAEYMHGGDPNYPDCSTNQLATAPNQAPGYLEYDILHEALHTLGFAPSCSPHNTRTAHVSDGSRDLMYSGDAPWNIAAGLILDINHDDYYNANVPGCIDLKNSAFLEGGGNQLPQGW